MNQLKGYRLAGQLCSGFELPWLAFLSVGVARNSQNTVFGSWWCGGCPSLQELTSPLGNVWRPGYTIHATMPPTVGCSRGMKGAICCNKKLTPPNAKPFKTNKKTLLFDPFLCFFLDAVWFGGMWLLGMEYSGLSPHTFLKKHVRLALV